MNSQDVDIDAVLSRLEEMANRSRRMSIFTDRIFHRGRASGLDDAMRELRAARRDAA
jgi:hypothetical protein